MQPVETANKYLEQGFEQLRTTHKISPAIVHALKEIGQSYQSNTNALYKGRNLLWKILYFFGIGLSSEERAQLKCVKKISQLKVFAKTLTLDYWTKRTQYSVKAVGKHHIEKDLTADTQSKDFLTQIYYSLKDPKTLTQEDFNKIKKIEGTKIFSTDLFFTNELRNFIHSEKLTPEEKKSTQQLLTAFEFSSKVNWKAMKYKHIQGYENQPWYPANAAAALHKAVHQMKSEVEVIFSATHMAKGKESGHAVLYSMRMLDNDQLCLRRYNTGLAAKVEEGSLLSGLWEGAKAMYQGDSFKNALKSSLSSTVDQAIFSKKDILSDEFSSIFSNELLNFDGVNAESDKLIFPKYEAFKQTHEIPKEQVPNAPNPPSIPMQVFGNCGIASKLTYMNDNLGNDLYNKFTQFLEQKIANR